MHWKLKLKEAGILFEREKLYKIEYKGRVIAA
jgi:hypothetical protein